MNNNIMMLVITMSLILSYGVILVVIVKQGFNKVLKQESRLSRYMKAIDEFERLIDTLSLKEPKEIISYRISEIKKFIKRFKNA